jgi:uncharacterized membrane protein
VFPFSLFQKPLLSAADEARVIEAIREAERNTSGEIRVHLIAKMKGEMLSVAALAFKKLDMHKTAARNGVLICVSMRDRQFAILGDTGIHEKVGAGFWDEVRDEMQEQFRKGDITQALILGISRAGQKLKEHFPYQDGDRNELNDRPSYA